MSVELFDPNSAEAGTYIDILPIPTEQRLEAADRGVLYIVFEFAGPVRMPGREEQVFRVRRSSAVQWGAPVNIEPRRCLGAGTCWTRTGWQNRKWWAVISAQTRGEPNLSRDLLVLAERAGVHADLDTQCPDTKN